MAYWTITYCMALHSNLWVDAVLCTYSPRLPHLHSFVVSGPHVASEVNEAVFKEGQVQIGSMGRSVLPQKRVKTGTFPPPVSSPRQEARLCLQPHARVRGERGPTFGFVLEGRVPEHYPWRLFICPKSNDTVEITKRNCPWDQTHRSDTWSKSLSGIVVA